MSEPPKNKFEFRPLTSGHWADVEQLFGPRGACGGCWCMYWRLKHRFFEAGKGPSNREQFKKLIAVGSPLGILCYDGKKAVGWCSVSPREQLVRLESSRYFKAPDVTRNIWAITCLFIRPQLRRQGLSKQLIKAACRYAKESGAVVVESFPIIPRDNTVPESFAWVGFASAYEQAGFYTVKQPSSTRLYMRYKV